MQNLKSLLLTWGMLRPFGLSLLIGVAACTSPSPRRVPPVERTPPPVGGVGQPINPSGVFPSPPQELPGGGNGPDNQAGGGLRPSDSPGDPFAGATPPLVPNPPSVHSADFAKFSGLWVAEEQFVNEGFSKRLYLLVINPMGQTSLHEIMQPQFSPQGALVSALGSSVSKGDLIVSSDLRSIEFVVGSQTPCGGPQAPWEQTGSRHALKVVEQVGSDGAPKMIALDFFLFTRLQDFREVSFSPMCRIVNVSASGVLNEMFAPPTP